MTRNYQRQRQRRLALTCLLAACSIAATLAMVAACRGQCPGGQCRPPGGWQSAPAPQPRWRAVPVGPNITAAVCRVRNRLGGGDAIGSGTLVHVEAGRAYVLTCRHLLDDGVGDLSVQFPDEAATPAKVFATDDAHDLAVLATTVPRTRPVRVTEYADSRTLVAIGLGGDGRLRAVRGELAGRSTPQGASYPSLVMHGAVRPGDSGGPVLNERGLVVGVVWGARGQTTYATAGPPLTKLLEKLPRDEPASTVPPVASEPHIAAKPASSPKCDCQCECSGDCVQRSELDRYATLSDLDELNRRSPGGSTPASSEQGEWIAGALGTLAAALGVGGPLGVAVFAAQLLLRRRISHRRGPGGPRAGGFQPEAGDRSAALRVEPAAEPARGRRYPSTAPERAA
ncbi:Serine protease Do-like HtrA [Posidoniimonas corsicana]|uniref:Serine protease Do-like HtrA n=1 Tax=Posidoniimonas corsicana TaxID=1938618 RepID=A0A5C5UX24_9BACT|nr:serine protease [Posidoniimonas corsicana]TWT30349.1 Serine protease Do-like HtrA [Posidoniimonas corsicana]